MANKPFFILSICLLSLIAPLSSQAQISDIPQTFQFEQSLYRNMESVQVKYLQIVLKELGTKIYPEAITSGYFGSLTTKAVTNFQLKYSIISSASHSAAGYVGPQTRAKLNEVLNNFRKTPETKTETKKEPEKKITTPAESQTLQVDQTIKGDLTVTENIKASRLYQENSNLIINTLGSGNIMLSAATGLHLYGSQVVIDSTNVLNPLVYIESPLRVDGALTQTGGDVTFGGDVSASTLNVSSLTASTLTMSGATTLTTLTVGTITSSGKLTITNTSTPQFTLKYDTSNYLDISIDSEGNVTLNATGTAPKFTFLDDVEISGSATTTGDFTVSGDLTAKTGRGATYVVAASDSATTSKAQADYVCDGTADDVEIQAAIDALPASGGEVRLLGGTYTFSAGVVARMDNLVISGVGKSTIIVFSGDGAAFEIGKTGADAEGGARCYNNTLKDLRIEGDGTSDENHFLYSFGMVNLRVLNNSFYQSGDEALDIRNGEDVIIEGNDFEDCSMADHAGAAMYISNAVKRVTISGNHLLGPASVSNITLRQINSGILEQVSIVNNTIEGTRTGISIFATTNSGSIIREVTIIGNVLSSLTGRGIDLGADSPAEVRGVIIVGNTFSDIGTGVRNETVANDPIYDTIISNNYFRNVTTPVLDNGTDTLIRNNSGYVTENSGTAILAAEDNSTTTNHGLASTPTSVIAIATSTDIGAIAVTSKTSTQFTITTSATTTENVGIYWEAKYEP